MKTVKKFKQVDTPTKLLLFVMPLSIIVAVLDAIEINAKESFLTLFLAQIIIYIKDLFPLLFFILGQAFSSQSKESRDNKILDIRNAVDKYKIDQKRQEVPFFIIKISMNII